MALSAAQRFRHFFLGSIRRLLVLEEQTSPAPNAVGGPGELDDLAMASRRMAEDAHRREENLARVFDTVADAITTVDQDGHIIMANVAAERILGVPRNELLGLTCTAPSWRITTVDGSPIAKDDLPFYRVMATGEALYGFEQAIEHPDGRRVILSVNAAPLRNPAGVVVGMVSCLSDITQRKRAEQALRFQVEASKILASSLDFETTLHSVARLAVPGLADWCVVALVGDDMLANPVAVAHAEPDKEELAREVQRQQWSDLRHARRIAPVLERGEPLIVSDLSARNLESLAHDAAHLQVLRELAPKSFMVVPLVARERAMGFVAFVATSSGRRYSRDDLSWAEDLARRAALAIDNARLYRDTLEAVRLRDEFLSVAAHELKTPVTNLRGFAQAIIRQLERDDVLDPPRVRRALEAIDRQSGRLAQFVRQILDVSQLEAGKLVLERRPTDVGQLVADAVAIAQVATSRHEINICGPTSVWAMVDPLRIEQVVANLIDNAIKYSPDGGTIEVALDVTRPELVCLTVRDHGIGVPAEHQQRIFERFYQAHPGAHLGGIGLGLYICSQIVQLHGGDLEAQFPADGGTRFVVSLPARLSDAPEVIEEEVDT